MFVYCGEDLCSSKVASKEWTTPFNMETRDGVDAKPPPARGATEGALISTAVKLGHPLIS